MTQSKAAAILYAMVGLYSLGCLLIPANPRTQHWVAMLADAVLIFMVVFCGVAARLCWKKEPDDDHRSGTEGGPYARHPKYPPGGPET
jgi:hypothetical protein